MWGVLQTQAQCLQIAERHLKAGGWCCYVPMLQQQGRAVPLFPGYAFFGLDDTWPRIDRLPGVLRVLRSGDGPAKLAERLVEDIRRQERNGVVVLPSGPRLQRGVRVRIIHGSFADRIGLHDGMSTRERQFVLLELLGRRVRVQVPNRYVQRVG
jgi:transcriptional antiterminator RfaH